VRRRPALADHRFLISRRAFLRSGAAALLAGFAPGRIAHAAAGSSDLAFLAVGDWGTGSATQRQVAEAMAKIAARDNIRFVVTTGDNFYSQGVASARDPLWRTVFEDVYSAPALQCPWYPTLGNHDHIGNAMAQVAYSQISTRWSMPAAFYWQSERLSGGSAADFFFLDTTPIVTENRWMHRFFPGDDADAQMQWLQQALVTSRARWKIVVGHHPLFSGGQHGSTPALVRLLQPLFERHGVKAYLSGHDHDLQHIVVNDVHYLTSGAGSKLRPTGKIAGTRFSLSELGFLRANLSPANMDIAFIGTQGQSLYTATVALTA
jgi:tartrate-resistant acid phosphatase type 5